MPDKTIKEELSSEILSNITIYSKYAKYLPEKKRRETWEEIVYRYLEMHIKRWPNLENEILEAGQYILDKKVLPSMRGLQFAGKPIEISPNRSYNCSYLAIDNVAAFHESMFLLLCGSGVGISVQKHHVEKLPEIIGPKPKRKRYLISDSIEGWSDAVKILIDSYFFGKADPDFDFRDIRPKGAILRTSGGKAPGPQPLKDCLHNVRKILDRVISDRGRGASLKPIDAHEVICFIADAVLAGGIRRASCISLFSFDDDEMLTCKFGSWEDEKPHLQRSNNSVVIVRNKIKEKDFFELWNKIVASKRGEPGIFFTNDKNMGANPCCISKDTNILTSDGYKKVEDLIGKDFYAIVNGKKYKTISNGFFSSGIKDLYRVSTCKNNSVDVTLDHKFLVYDMGRDKSIWKELSEIHLSDSVVLSDNNFDIVSSIEFIKTENVYDVSIDEVHEFSGNGFRLHNCEISLKSEGFCNLTTINASDIESQEEFNKRSIMASRLGTLQAAYTDFHYLRESWKTNSDKEALLGVSMTGIASNKIFGLNVEEAVASVLAENKRVAKLIGINPAKRTTTVKPEGTASLVLGCSSGVHAWHSQYYIRRMRLNKTEPLYKYLKKKIPDLLEDEFFRPETDAVLSIPIKAPENAILRNESPFDLLNRVKVLHQKWIKPGHISGQNTHNVSCTVSVKDDEYNSVGKWMWDNKNYYNGITIIPYDGGDYKQMPFEDCTKEQYEKMLESLKEIDLSKIIEEEDITTLKDESACSGGGCTITHV